MAAIRHFQGLENSACMATTDSGKATVAVVVLLAQHTPFTAIAHAAQGAKSLLHIKKPESGDYKIAQFIGTATLQTIGDESIYDINQERQKFTIAGPSFHYRQAFRFKIKNIHISAKTVKNLRRFTA